MNEKTTIKQLEAVVREIYLLPEEIELLKEIRGSKRPSSFKDV